MNITQKRIPDDVAEIIVSELIRSNQEGKMFRHNSDLAPRMRPYVLGDAYQDHYAELHARAKQLS